MQKKFILFELLFVFSLGLFPPVFAVTSDFDDAFSQLKIEYGEQRWDLEQEFEKKFEDLRSYYDKQKQIISEQAEFNSSLSDNDVDKMFIDLFNEYEEKQEDIQDEFDSELLDLDIMFGANFRQFNDALHDLVITDQSDNSHNDLSSLEHNVLDVLVENNQICIDKVWIENSKGKIACVFSSTADKLIERGWGTLIEEKQIQFIPLPSWNDGNSKQKIIDFVDKVTNPSSSSFVFSENRIATFNNDGTLWIEQPIYIPFAFHLEYLYEQIEHDPSLSTQSPYKEILEKKGSLSNESLDEIPGLVEILLPSVIV